MLLAQNLGLFEERRRLQQFVVLILPFCLVTLPGFSSGFGKEMEIISGTRGTKPLEICLWTTQRIRFSQLMLAVIFAGFMDISRLYGYFQAFWKPILFIR